MPLQELPLTPNADAMANRSIAIKVVGVGGAGGNAVDRLKMDDLDRLQMAVINTDLQALNSSPVGEKVLIGSAITRGLGAGGEPELGTEAAESDREKITEVVKDCDLIFLIGGLGGGTASGAMPIVAEVAGEAGALVISFVTLPFSFEGGRRGKLAEEALVELRRCCDAVVPLPNDVLLQEEADGESALDSFARADEWIGRSVKSIWAMMFRTGLINLDFATLRQAFHTRGGKTLFALGSGEGADAVERVVESLGMCPLMGAPEMSRKADRLLVNIVGGTDLTLAKVNTIMTAVNERYGRDSLVIMGAVIDEELQGRVEVCVLGTSDVGGRLPSRRPPTSRTRAAERSSLEALHETASAPAATPAKTTGTGTGKRNRAVHLASDKQDEFTFQNASDNRGHFERTDRNLFEGQDLDVPTYLRKGIKISV